MSRARPRTTTSTPAAPAAPAAAPPPSAAVLPARPELVRVRTLIPHEGHYRGEEDTVLLTPRVRALIAGGILRLLGDAPAPPAPQVTIIHPPPRR